MAESNLHEMVLDILTCSICIEEAHDPRTLPCQHTYCLECLKKYIDSKERKYEIECPFCRTMCPLPNGNVDDLPPSFLYTQLKDANTIFTTEKKKETFKDNVTESECRSQEAAKLEQEGNTDKICSSDGCDKAAESFCKSCKYICPDCYNDHKTVRAMKSHVILTLNEAATMQKNEPPLCSKHHDERLKLFCEDCSSPICYMCFSVEHATHKCVELIIKADKEKDKLGNVMRTIKDYLNKCCEMSNSITLHSEKLHEICNNVKCQVKERADEIILEVKCREEAIKQDVEQNYKQVDKVLNAETDKVNLMQGILQNLQYSSNQLFLYGSHYEFVTKGKSIDQTVQDNNPDDVELNLPELDMSEAEIKLHDMKVRIMITLHTLHITLI